LGRLGKQSRFSRWLALVGPTDGFELIGEAREDQAIILIAIKINRDRAGRYIVASTYTIDRNKLQRRVRKRFLKPF
jgi:hypothetical protein